MSGGVERSVGTQVCYDVDALERGGSATVACPTSAQADAPADTVWLPNLHSITLHADDRMGRMAQQLPGNPIVRLVRAIDREGHALHPNLSRVPLQPASFEEAKEIAAEVAMLPIHAVGFLLDAVGTALALGRGAGVRVAQSAAEEGAATARVVSSARPVEVEFGAEAQSATRFVLDLEGMPSIRLAPRSVERRFDPTWDSMTKSQYFNRQFAERLREASKASQPSQPSTPNSLEVTQPPRR